MNESGISAEHAIKTLDWALRARRKEQDGVCRECVQDWPCYTVTQLKIVCEALT